MEFCLQTQTDEEIPLSSMNNKQEINNRYGPVNVVSLTMKNVKGENVTLRDDKSIDKYGENTIEIQDNPFVYTEALREKAIEELYSALDGFSYYPINFNWKARLYTDPSDIIKVYDMRNNEWVNSIVMNQTIKIPVTRQSTLESPALTKTQVANQYISQSKQANTRTEIMVDKQEQKIKGIISQIGDRSQKTTTITADINGLSSKVEDIEYLVDNTSGMTQITLTNCYPGNIIELRIYGNNSVFDGLKPSNTLVPSDTLVPSGDSTIVVTDKDNVSKEYDFGEIEVLRRNGDTTDEFVVEKDKAYVIRRINRDGTIKLHEIIEEIGNYSIQIGEDTNTIRIKNYVAKISGKWAIKSDYTDVFATKVEMNSSITQTAKEINLEVRKKVDERKIISKINQSAEKISIEANKININGVISANGNFEIDTSGNLKCINGIFSGDIYTENNGKIVSASKGIISTLFATNGGNINGYTFLGYATDGTQLLRTSPFVGIYIPSNFMPVQAYLIIEQISSTISVEAGSTTCRAQSIKVRKGGTGPSIDLARICK